MSIHVAKSGRLRLFNNCLTGVLALLAVYIMVVPFLPQFAWWLRHDSPVHRVLPGAKPPVVVPTVAAEPTAQKQGDQLFIPRLNMDEIIYGGTIHSLSKGVWHLPKSSTPDKGGNTVLVGHRFTYSGAAVFYNLDKVQKDDPITLLWQGKVYEYKVFAIKVVPPTEVSVEVNTQESMLTIYTCTPLWSAKNRLVIQAKSIGAN